jgi:hypothetical protein
MPDSTHARPVAEEFLVAFSFAGEQRRLVGAIAQEVERRLGRGTVFYDEWFEHYLAGDDADLKLQEIYLKRSVLAVVCVSKCYGDKPWTQSEHRAVRARQMEADDPKHDRNPEGVLLLRVGDGDVPGILCNAIVPDVRKRQAGDSATLIVERLRLVAPTLVPTSAPAGNALPASAGLRMAAPLENLHFLCDRDEQIGALDVFFGGAKREHFLRPVLVIVHGGQGAAHSIFVERLCDHELPGRFHRLGFAGGIQRVQPAARLTAREPASLAMELREKLVRELQFETACYDDAQLIECVRKNRTAVLAPVFDLSSGEAFAGEHCYVAMLRDYWSGFPDLPPGLAVICFLCVTYSDASPENFLRRLFSGGKSAVDARLRGVINQLGADPAGGGGVRVIHKVLAELGPVGPGEVERWFNHPIVSRAVRERLQATAIQERIFGGRPELPMEQVLEALERFLSD